MASLYPQERWSQRINVNQTNDCIYGLESTQLLPIISFESREQKGHNLRCEGKDAFSTLNHFSRNNKAKTNRIESIENSKDLNEEQFHFSNIKQLKNHVLQLENEYIGKLGKENESCQILWHKSKSITTPSEFIFDKSSVKQYKKLSKRKIVKGRPQAYAIQKKHKIVMDLLQQQKPLSNITNQSMVNPIRDILNTNSLLKYISSINSKEGFQNLYDNFMRESVVKRQNQTISQQSQSRKQSLITLRNYKNPNLDQKQKKRADIIGSRQFTRKQQRSLASKRRYLSENRMY